MAVHTTLLPSRIRRTLAAYSPRRNRGRPEPDTRVHRLDGSPRGRVQVQPDVKELKNGKSIRK